MGRPKSCIVLTALVASLLLPACGDDNGPPDAPEPGAAAALTVGGHHACRLLADGRALCWGRADAGQLGIDSTPLSATATPVAAGGVSFTRIAAGGLHTCALAGNGTPWCWGQNGAGQAGLPIAMNQVCGEPVHGWRCVPSPHPVETMLRFDSLVAGAANTCGFSTDGVIYCWGSNSNGQLGPGATDDCSGSPCSWTPVPVGGPELQTLALGSGAHFCGLTADGRAYCWGSNDYGELGAGTVGGNRSAPSAVVGGHRFRAIAVGGQHTCALDTGGKPWCWGGDILPPGDGGISLSATPVLIQDSPAFTDLVTGPWAACGRTSIGVVSCWGINAYGEMGIRPAGLNTRYETPQEMEGHWVWQVLGGELGTFCGLDAAGATWCWGFGIFGELGPVHEASSVPVRIQGV